MKQIIVVFALLMGGGILIYGCSKYSGSEAIKPKQEAIYENVSVPLEALLVVNTYYIAYMDLLKDTNSTWQQATTARNAVIENFSVFKA